MPFMNGLNLAENLQNKKASLKVLFMSGHTEDTIRLKQILEQGKSFIAKPFLNGSLVKKIEEILGASC
jgi:FixJ family two-component response regulator